MHSPWFDRQEILAGLKKRLEGFLAGYRQNLALLGPKGMGKTTLLMRLLHPGVLPEGSVVRFYLEVRPEETFPEWTARFIQSFLTGFLQTKQQETPTELPKLLLFCQRFVPSTAQMARHCLLLAEAGRTEEAYDKLWDLSSSVVQETGIPCLLILDEFHLLQRLKVKDPFLKLGRKIMVQTATLYLLVSSKPTLARSILREGLNLLFGQFEILEIGPLDPPACRKAIQTCWNLSAQDPFLENLLLELVQGYPIYLDKILQGLGEIPPSHPVQGQVRTILDVLESLLLIPGGSLRILFEERLRLLKPHGDRRLWIEVLRAVAQGLYRAREIAQRTDRSPSQVVRALKALEQSGLVVRQGVFYRVPDRLFGLWLLTAFPLLEGAGITDPTQLKARFRDLAWGWMADIQQAYARPLKEHLLDFLSRWSGEFLEVDGRKAFFPLLGRIESEVTAKGLCLIFAHRSGRSGKDWIVVPWTGGLEESQAALLGEDLSIYPFQRYRRVLMGAYPVDIHARLVLQECKVRLWDLPTLNHLLDLYGMIRIPLTGPLPWKAESLLSLAEEGPSLPRSPDRLSEALP